jgi:hypothetical protein
MTTTNDAMYAALRLLYPEAGATLGDLLAAHWIAVGPEGQTYRGSLGYEYYVLQGASGTTLADLANDFWAEDYPILIDALIFDYNDPDEWLELEVFNRFDTVEQQVILI